MTEAERFWEGIMTESERGRELVQWLRGQAGIFDEVGEPGSFDMAVRFEATAAWIERALERERWLTEAVSILRADDYPPIG